MREQVLEVSLKKIRINPYQPRRQFDESALIELAASLKEVGIIHPPLVRKLSHSDHYELVAGERRLRAAALAGFEKIPVLVRAADTFLSAQTALIENLQRSDLNPIEIAQAMRQIIRDFDLTQEQLAAKLLKKRSTVANYLRLLTLPDEMQQAVACSFMTMGHAKVLLSMENGESRKKLFEAIVEKNITVREAEKWAKKRSLPDSAPACSTDFYLPLKKQLESHFGTKVRFQPRGKESGCIVFDYYSNDDLQRLLQLFEN